MKTRTTTGRAAGMIALLLFGFAASPIFAAASEEENSLPTVDFVSTGGLVTNHTATFEATAEDAESAADNLTIEWDFTDDDEFVAEATGAAASTSFETAGDVVVSVRVTDEANASVTQSKTFTVVENAAPALSISAPADPLFLGYPLTFTATVTDEPSDVPTVEWDFIDDGTWTPRREGVSTEYTYGAPGTYNVTARATDVAGEMVEEVIEVEIFSGPVIRVHTLGLPEVNSVATLTAASTRDNEDGDNVSIEWDFTDDGEFIAEATGPEATYTWATPGFHPVWVRATDSDDNAPVLMQLIGVDDFVTIDLTILGEATRQGLLQARVDVADWQGEDVANATVTIGVLYQPEPASNSFKLNDFQVTTGEDGSVTFLIPRDSALGNLPGKHVVTAYVAVMDTPVADRESASDRADYVVPV